MSEAEKYIALTEYDKPSGGRFEIYIDHWWITNDAGNPLVHIKHGSPQCNRNEAIARRIAHGKPVRQIPIVYVPARLME